MLFVIHALDRAGALPERLAHYEAHKAFLSDTSAFQVSIVMSGAAHGRRRANDAWKPLCRRGTGSGAVERFNAADPFHRAGIWERVTITGFIRRQG
jgi:uncharacterized protein YciI